MTPFERALDFTLRWETGGRDDGGLTHDPHDSGGRTRWGITERSYPDLDIEHLTRERAIEIYRSDYWNRLRCDDLSESVATAVFDFAVNSGQLMATRALQRAVGCVADGIIGDKTIHAVGLAELERMPGRLAVQICVSRARHLARISDGKNSRYLEGWMARVVELSGLVGAIGA